VEERDHARLLNVNEDFCREVLELRQALSAEQQEKEGLLIQVSNQVTIRSRRSFC
jgi:hypothetical protein